MYLICERPSKNDDSFVKKFVHTCGMLRPAGLFPAGFATTPPGTRYKKAAKVLFRAALSAQTYCNSQWPMVVEHPGGFPSAQFRRSIYCSGIVDRELHSPCT